MCGICGILQTRPEAQPPDRPELERMHAALAPRGPDGEGVWASPDGRLLLAHRRLAILDLSPSGAQPMASADGRFVIVFNGEIYNYRSLREELLASGAGLRSQSDTEVILELWRRRGPQALAALRGMYAFALADRSTGELFLVRDPCGIKPLYYSFSNGVLRFASQVKALEAGGAVSLEVDPAAVSGLLAWGSIPEPHTFRRAIEAIPAGRLAIVSREGDLRLVLAPATPGPEGRSGVDPAEIAGTSDNSNAAIAASVRAHLVSDVPVGLFLSAGLDSALIAALASREALEKPRALTLTWAGARGTHADEGPLARATAKALGLPHVVREITGSEVRGHLDAIVGAMDQPSIDGFNSWLISRLAREEGMKVVLSGLGGDEIFGGYSSFVEVPAWQRRAARLRQIPGLQTAWPGLVRLVAPSRARRSPKLTSVLRYADSIAGAYALRRAVYLPHEVDEILLSAGLARPGDRPYDATFDAWDKLGESTLGDTSALLSDPWIAVHRLESSLYLRNQLLRDADWAGMAHGLEIRVPFVDATLRRTLESSRFASARQGGKAALVRRLAPELPEALFRRPKSGFQLPIADWLEPDSAFDGPRPAGTQSRRLALLVLERFGVKLSAPGEELQGEVRENQRTA